MPGHFAAVIGALAFATTPLDDWDGLRSRIASAGDVNCDGTPDLLLASRNPTGEVHVLCGRDGAVLLRVAGESPGDGFGRSVAGVGDIDHDGHADFAVAAQRDVEPERGISSESGYVNVFSGRNGVRLLRLTSGIADDSFGLYVAGGGDVDADGFPDIVVTDGDWASECSFAHVFSGKSGGLVAELRGSLGLISATLGPDMDGDGHAEAILGSGNGFVARQEEPGPFEVRWGLKRPLATVETSFGKCGQAASVWALSADGDADGDGVADVLVSQIHCGVDVFSGRTKRLLHSIAYGTHRMYAAGSSIDWVGDVNADGCDDFVVAANEAAWGQPPNHDKGFTYVYSGRTAELLHAYEPWKKRMDACRAGDANQDGTPDIAVFVEEDRAVRVLSGRDLTTVWEVRLDDLRR